jgi:hypothetical protein
MTKRDFLKVLATGAAGAFTGLASAWADPTRILGPGRPSHDAEATGETSPGLKRLMTQVRVGDARSHGAMQVFWLHGPMPSHAFRSLRSGRRARAARS